MRDGVDQRERIDGFDAAGRLVDVHRWDPRAHRHTDPAVVRAVIIADMARNQGAVTARILKPDSASLTVREQTVQQLKEFPDGEA